MSGAISGTTLAIMGGVGAAGTLGGAALSAHAAGSAADEQSQAAQQAAQLQYQASQNALDFQKQQWNQTQQNQAPWLNSGTGALSNLDYLMGINPQTPASFAGVQGASGAPNAGISNTFSPSNPGVPASVIKANGGMPPQQAYGSPVSGARMSTPQGLAGGNMIASGGPSNVMHGSLGSPTGGGPSSNVSVSPLSGTVGFNGPPANPTTPAGTNITPPSAPAAGAPTAGTPGGFGSLMQPWDQTFQAPTDITEQNDPGYQARLKLGTDAIQRSAAAAGGVVTGGTAQALDQYGQDYASNEYNNVYNRALTGYNTNYNTFENNQANQFNRLAALSGVGQTAASNLANAGQSASNNVSSNLIGTANNMGQSYQNAAAANASGVVGSSNAWSGALGGIGNSMSNLMMLNQLYGGGGGGNTGFGGGGGMDDVFSGL